MNIDFEMLYINVNFDDILIENNNPLVNSEDVYLKYKTEYFEQTNKNYNMFKKLSEELENLEGNQGYTTYGSKYTYIYNDVIEIEKLRLTIKQIVIAQRKLYKNFYHYVNLLNSKREAFEQPKNPSVKRSILSMLFDKK
jgi:hypothetical protein